MKNKDEHSCKHRECWSQIQLTKICVRSLLVLAWLVLASIGRPCQITFRSTVTGQRPERFRAPRCSRANDVIYQAKSGAVVAIWSRDSTGLGPASWLSISGCPSRKRATPSLRLDKWHVVLFCNVICRQISIRADYALNHSSHGQQDYEG